MAGRREETLIRRANATRARRTSGSTKSNALWSIASSCGVAHRPSNHHDKTAEGSDLTGARRMRNASGVSWGIGDLEKLVERTTPRRFLGGLAAIEIAIGPENDSPRSTNGAADGSADLTRDSRSS